MTLQVLTVPASEIKCGDSFGEEPASVCIIGGYEPGVIAATLCKEVLRSLERTDGRLRDVEHIPFGVRYFDRDEPVRVVRPVGSWRWFPPEEDPDYGDGDEWVGTRMIRDFGGAA